MRPMLRLMRDDPELELQLVTTDMHLKEEFGFTLNEVEEDFEDSIEKIFMNIQGRESRAEQLAELHLCLATMFGRSVPDILVLMGDRAESLIAAVVATQFNVPIAHIQGGDTTGGIDNPQRNAISKLAHVHFTSCQRSTHELCILNELPWRIHEVGDLHIDPIVQGDFLPQVEVRDRLDLGKLSPSVPIITVLQHPDTYNPTVSGGQMQITLQGVARAVSDRNVVCIYPCSDQGYKGIIDELEEFRVYSGLAQVHKNLPSPLFLGLLNVTDVIVGNSSSGVIEAPYFGLRAVDIGYRQKGRLSCDLTKWVPHDSNLIAKAIKESIETGPGKVNNTLYGDGHAGERVVKVLKELEINNRLLRK